MNNVFFRSKKRQVSEHEQLLLEIQKTKEELNATYCKLSYVVDPDMVDCIIYQLNSTQKHYDYLLIKAKHFGICHSFL